MIILLLLLMILIIIIIMIITIIIKSLSGTSHLSYREHLPSLLSGPAAPVEQICGAPPATSNARLLTYYCYYCYFIITIITTTTTTTMIIIVIIICLLLLLIIIITINRPLLGSRELSNWRVLGGLCRKAGLWLSSSLRCSDSIFWRNSGEIPAKFRRSSGEASLKTRKPTNKSIAQPPHSGLRGKAYKARRAAADAPRESPPLHRCAHGCAWPLGATTTATTTTTTNNNNDNNNNNNDKLMIMIMVIISNNNNDNKHTTNDNDNNNSNNNNTCEPYRCFGALVVGSSTSPRRFNRYGSLSTNTCSNISS